MRLLAVLLLAPAIACAQNWQDLLKKGAEAAAQEIKKQQSQKPAPAKPASSTPPAAQPVAQAKPAAAASGELLPLRKLPHLVGEFGIYLLVQTDGTVLSWGIPQGDGSYIGDGTTNGREEPAPLAGVTDIVDAAISMRHSALLRRDGTVLTWGRNDSCELTVKDDRKRVTPFQVPGVRNAVQIAATIRFTAAVLRDGSVMVWGSNGDGFLANGKKENGCQLLPVLVEGLSGVKKLVVDNSILVLKHDGTVWGWGPNSNGELCDGTTEARYRPVQMKGIANAVDIDIDNVSAVVLADGTVWRCGTNAHSEMAKKQEPESVKYATPQQIPGITTAVAVRTRGATFVRLKDGTLLGWGSGIFGGLGNGRFEGTFPKPTPPTGLGPVLDHFMASPASFAIRADGTLMMWGNGSHAMVTPQPFLKLKLAL